MKRQQIEKAIVRRLIRTMKTAGYVVDKVWDGEEYTNVVGEQDTLDVVFNLDDCTIHFRALDKALDEARSHGVYLVMGNGEDIVSDWHCGDPAFDRVLENLSDWVTSANYIISGQETTP